MSKRLQHVTLTFEQKDRLEAIACTGTHPVRQIVVARLLLKAAVGEVFKNTRSSPGITSASASRPSRTSSS